MMAILPVFGVMDLRSMTVLAAAITVERLAPAGERVVRTIVDGSVRREYPAVCIPAALVALLTADIAVSMPPISLEYHGRDIVASFFASLMRRRTYALVPTRANGQPAFGAYLCAPSGGISHGTGLFVLTLTGDRICALARFENSVLPWFELPRSLPA
jgi:hypothetical protein